MNNNTYQRPVVEFDLRNWFWKLLSQWKAVLLVSLIMALLICGLKHMKDMRSYKTMKAVQTENTTQTDLTSEERIAEAMAVLSDEEKGAVNYIVEQKELVNDYKKYIKKSIFFNTDTVNQRILRLTYDVNVDNAGDLPVIMQTYKMFITGDRFAEAIKGSIDSKAETCYISELVQFDLDNQAYLDNSEGRGVLKFGIVLPEDIDSKAVVSNATQALKEYQSELQASYPASVSNVSSQETHMFVVDNAAKKTNTLYYINNLNTNIKNAESVLSDQQKQIVNTIMSIKAEADNTSDYKDGEDVKDEETISAPGWSKKYAVLGFALGALVYAGAYLLISLLRGCIESAQNAETAIGARLIGEVYYENERTSIQEFLFHSKLVDKVHYHGKTDSEREINKIAASLESLCGHFKLSNLSIMNMVSDKSTSEKFSKMVLAACKNRGVEINILNVAEGIDDNIINTAKNAVVAVDGRTKTSDLCNLVKLCESYDVSLRGSIFADSI